MVIIIIAGQRVLNSQPLEDIQQECRHVFTIRARTERDTLTGFPSSPSYQGISFSRSFHLSRAEREGPGNSRAARGGPLQDLVAPPTRI